MATSGKIQPGDEVEAYNGDGGLVLSVDCYGQDVIVHHTGMYPKVWAARELKVVRRGVFDVRELGAAEQNPVGWSVDEWNGLRWAYQARGWWAQSVSQGHTELGDWKRSGSGWTRDGNEGGAHVADHSEPGVFRALVCGTLLGGRFTCPDAAREAADAYLVSQGRLDKSRAFVRLGEWEPAPECGKGYMMRRQASGATPLTMTARGEEGRASSDASAVANGWLDPSRAFKAGPTSATRTDPKVTDWLCTPNTATRIPPQMYNATKAPPVLRRQPDLLLSAEQFNALSEWSAKPAAKTAWGDWERIGVAYVRRPSDRGAVPVAAYVDRWELGGDKRADATDVDDAREKADAFLVARGELEAGRAFKRVGDWAPDKGAWHRLAHDVPAVRVDRYGWGVPTTAGVSGSMGNETSDAGKAAADAELVRRGLLAESRAFKVAEPFTFKGSATYTYTLGPSAPVACEVSHDDGVTWEQAQAGVTLGPKSQLRYKASPRSLTGVPTMQPGTYREVVFAATDQTTVTLANWERCLPLLLSSAPREFRDGFDRKQGEAWEAYLRGLAWVKEQIQCKRVAPHSVATAIVLATGKAQGAMGPEWVKANVREPSPKWEAALDSRMGHR